jgi:hypothetical protein
MASELTVILVAESKGLFNTADTKPAIDHDRAPHTLSHNVNVILPSTTSSSKLTFSEVYSQ